MSAYRMRTHLALFVSACLLAALLQGCGKGEKGEKGAGKGKKKNVVVEPEAEAVPDEEPDVITAETCTVQKAFDDVFAQVNGTGKLPQSSELFDSSWLELEDNKQFCHLYRFTEKDGCEEYASIKWSDTSKRKKIKDWRENAATKALDADRNLLMICNAFKMCLAPDRILLFVEDGSHIEKEVKDEVVKAEKDPCDDSTVLKFEPFSLLQQVSLSTPKGGADFQSFNDTRRVVTTAYAQHLLASKTGALPQESPKRHQDASKPLEVVGPRGKTPSLLPKAIKTPPEDHQEPPQPIYRMPRSNPAVDSATVHEMAPMNPQAFLHMHEQDKA